MLNFYETDLGMQEENKVLELQKKTKKISKK